MDIKKRKPVGSVQFLLVLWMRVSIFMVHMPTYENWHITLYLLCKNTLNEIDPSTEITHSTYFSDKLFYKSNYSRINKYFIKFSLFSKAVVVGLPKSSLAPIEHFTSIKLNSFLPFASANSLSKSKKESTETA